MLSEEPIYLALFSLQKTDSKDSIKTFKSLTKPNHFVIILMKALIALHEKNKK